MGFEEYQKLQDKNNPVILSKTTKQEDKEEDKLKVFLSKIHKQKMHFVGAQLQDKVLHIIHELLLEKKSILRSNFLTELTLRLEPYIADQKISKTKINGILNIIQAGRCFDISKNTEDSKALLALSEKYWDYKELRKLHDLVLLKLAKECGVSFSAREWSIFLYGNAQKTKEIEQILP